MRQLGGKRGADGVEVQCLAAIVYRHLSPLARLLGVAEALVGEVIHAKPAEQQHSVLAILREDLLPAHTTEREKVLPDALPRCNVRRAISG